jgi:2'-5' RNA ligase
LVNGLLRATTQDSHNEIFFFGEGRNINYQVVKDLYSIVIMPDDNGIKKVKDWKDDLKAKINSWYNSYNSKAHITISEFLADEDEIVGIIDHLKEIAGYENSIHINFEGVKSYPNGAVFLAPDEPTKNTLSDFMKRIQKNLNLKKSYHSKDPHMSIGRKLNEKNVAIALEMFKEARLEFDCTSIALRKFNPNEGVKQYEIQSENFPFLGLHPKPPAQQSLF